MVLKEGQSMPLETDPCVKCECRQGTLFCSKKSCPVLSCQKIKQIPAPDGCCKTCNGMLKLLCFTLVRV